MDEQRDTRTIQGRKRGGRMTRPEENKMIIEEMERRVERKPTGTYEEMVAFQLGAIATMLSDISRSLALLADNIECEDKECI